VKSREGEPIPVPYCGLHMKAGDGALKVVKHPFAGKCLVARWALPPKYRMAFFGIRGRCPSCEKDDRAISFYPPCQITGKNRDAATGDTIAKYNGVLNPDGTGDLIQYAACPGPQERQNMRSTFQYWGKRNGKIGGLEFITLEKIPANTQLCHWYGDGWWAARGVKRRNVGTREHPAPKRDKVKRRRRQKRNEEGIKKEKSGNTDGGCDDYDYDDDSSDIVNEICCGSPLYAMAV